ncbi:hypothetical protein BJP37_16760 [Moorena bouillonii PNG]|uniref:Uncharacterized protein n=1 Tax=Moorena bouillonii PNG TaxID=568701 RepID=A0A1U7N3A5_9CYAN|nr:hypothetical protein BJP37_16760 [Moorena bouillonii PNG]
MGCNFENYSHPICIAKNIVKKFGILALTIQKYDNYLNTLLKSSQEFGVADYGYGFAPLAPQASNCSLGGPTGA